MDNNTDIELFETPISEWEEEDIFYDCQEVISEDYQGNPSNQIT